LNNSLNYDKFENKDNDEYNISSLFERLLLDEKYINYHEMIEDFKNNIKKSKKSFNRFKI